MSDPSSSDSVAMEFGGPVPGILGSTRDYHLVFWVQSAGGASFTRPSAEERAYYQEKGKVVPEWQCEYFEFENVTWCEAALTVELWHGKTKLRSLFLAKREGRRESDVRAELPDLAQFMQRHRLAFADLMQSFHDALLQAADSAGVIQRGATPVAGAKVGTGRGAGENSWLKRTLRRVWSVRRAA